jgi:hypothetical protein
MLTDTFDVVLVIVVFHLAAFALALVVLGLYALADGAVSSLRRFWSYMQMARSTEARLAEIRRIGEQARREMEQMSFEFVQTVSKLRRR